MEYSPLPRTMPTNEIRSLVALAFRPPYLAPRGRQRGGYVPVILGDFSALESLCGGGAIGH
jgi:hypothetical protein